MSRIAGLLRNRNFIMILAVVLGLAWDRGAYLCKDLMLPALALIMTLATMGVTGNVFRSLSAMVIPAAWGVSATYLFHGSLLLGLNALLIHNHDFRAGFILLAAVPPAVAVIPFAYFLKADCDFALMGTIGGYLAALLVTPLTAVTFLGSGFINPAKVFVTLIELIIAPLILSRILARAGIARRIEPAKGAMINWSFFLAVYIITGLNRDIILEKPSSLIPVAAIGFLCTFVFGWIIERAGKILKIDSKVATSLVLLGTYKNYGLAGGLALVFFNPETAIPATVTSTISILYIIYLEIRSRRTAVNL